MYVYRVELVGMSILLVGRHSQKNKALCYKTEKKV